MQPIVLPLEDGAIEIGIHRYHGWRPWYRWVSCASIRSEGEQEVHLHHNSFTRQAAIDEAYALYRVLVAGFQEGGSDGPRLVQ